MGNASRGASGPGAMTQAMRAVSNAGTERVLRIGVIQGGRVIDERIVRDRGAVRVGTTERATIAVSGIGAPRCHELFCVHGEHYLLKFTDAMEGRIALEGRLWTLAELRSSERAARIREGWAVQLTESARGKVVVGNASLLFQFVLPPPRQPRPQLPVAIRINPIKAIDWGYSACLAFFVAAGFGALSYAEYIYDPTVEDAMETRWIRALLPPPMPPETSPTIAEPGSNTLPGPSSSHRATAETRPPSHADTRGAHAIARDRDSTSAAAIAAVRASDVALNALSHSLEFSALPGYAPGAPGGVIDAFANGAVINGTVTALANASHIASNEAAFARRGGAMDCCGHGSSFAGHRLETPTEVRTGDPGNLIARAPHGTVNPEQPDVPDDPHGVNPDAVARVVRQNLGGIRWCYNQGLAQNPTLQGRIDVQVHARRRVAVRFRHRRVSAASRAQRTCGNASSRDSGASYFHRRRAGAFSSRSRFSSHREREF